MNRATGRRCLAVVVTASALASLTACTSKGAWTAAAPSASTRTSTGGPTTSPPPAGFTLTDGTADVLIGTSTVHFGSTVTGGAWSPDGSRLAYVDADGNIATARADGSGVTVLTTASPGVQRAHPTWYWYGQTVVFTQRDNDGPWRVVNTGPDGSVSDQALGLATTGGDTAPATAASHNMLAYQHKGASGPQVWVLDGTSGGSTSRFLADGSMPQPSPDGTRIAYLSPAGRLSVRPVGSGKATALTPALTGVDSIAWSADGTRLFFDTGRGVESVATSHPAAPAVVVTRHGTVSVQPSAEARAARFTGADPVADAVALSKAVWRADLPARAVTVVSTTDPVALTLPRAIGAGPVLFTAADTLDPRTATELRRLRTLGAGSTQPTVTVVGGTDVVSAQVEHAITALGYRVNRIEETVPEVTLSDSVPATGTIYAISDTDVAALVNAHQLTGSGTVMVVHGEALSGDQAGVLRQHTGDIPGDPFTLYAVGPAAATAVAAVAHDDPLMRVTDIPGGDLQTESVAIIPGYESRQVVFATDDPAALLLAASTDQPVIVLGKGEQLGNAAKSWLSGESATLDEVTAFGSREAIPDAVLDTAGTLISGPGGCVHGPYDDRSF